MRRLMRFRLSFIALTLMLSLIGPGVGGRGAPASVLDTSPVIGADSGAVPRYEPAACPWKLPEGQTEGQTVSCGFAVVPELHRNPTGPTIRLPVAVFKSASPTPAPDPVIYLQGGPGGAVDDFISGFLDTKIGTYTADRDLIVFDQRGIGFAQPTLDCPEVKAQEFADAAVNSGTTEKIDHEITSVLGCRDRLVGQRINLGAYTSAESAADVNDIRAVLGYEKLNLLGVSYGTRIALTIMRDFPNAVRSAVLDSSVPLQANLIEDNFANFDRALNLLFAGCVADQACTTKYPAFPEDFSAVIAQLNTQPVTTTYTDAKTEKKTPVVIDGVTLMSLISEMLYDANATRYIPQLVAQVKAGQMALLSLVLNAFGPTGADVNVGAYFSTLCSEEVPFNDRERATAAARSVRPELQPLAANDVRENFEVCAQWPTQPLNPVETQAVTSDLPTLVLSSDNDPATPPSYGQQVAQTLPKGFLVTFPGIGHSILGNGGSCGTALIFAFINDPTKQPATDCVGK